MNTRVFLRLNSMVIFVRSSLGLDLLRVGQQPARNPIDAAEKYPKNNKNKKQERKQTQYLTRFDNFPTSSG